jgi:hypothetical protein
MIAIPLDLVEQIPVQFGHPEKTETTLLAAKSSEMFVSASAELRSTNKPDRDAHRRKCSELWAC